MKKSVKVFKKLRLFLLLALALLLLVRCEKDPLVVVPVKCTVDISAGAGGGGTVDPSGKIEVIKGKELNITFTSNPGYKIDTVFVNGVEFPLTNNVYPFVASSGSSKVEGVFTKTNLWYLIQGSWTLTGLTSTAADYYWKANFTTRDSVFVHTATFDSNNWVKSYFLNGSIKWNDPYRLTSDSLFIGNNGAKYKVVELTPTKMVLQTLSPRGDGTTIFEYLTDVFVFEHKK